MALDDSRETLAPVGAITGREHVLPVRVYYEDTDFARHVYHANYVRYLERGRSEFLRALGLNQTDVETVTDPWTFVVTRLNMDFRRPARIDDTLLVRTTYERFKGPRVFTRQTITRNGEIVLTAEAEMAVIALDGRPRRPCRSLLKALAPYLQPAARQSGSQSGRHAGPIVQTHD